MACTTVTCPTCNTGYSGGCCPSCQPANVIYQGECTDPGTITVGRFVSVLDYKFCERRLTNAAGFLVSNQNGSGNFGISFTSTPQVQLSEVTASADTAFGQLIVMGSDYRWRALVAPGSAGLFLQSNATGDIIFGDPPAAVVPDPLVVDDLTVTTSATLEDVTTNGTLTLNNLSTGTVVNLLGLDAGNEVVLQAIAAGVAGSMFYEAPTSPSATTPNESKANGSNLVIGNRLFDSGANLISVTTSEVITVNVAGKYAIFWRADCRLNASAQASVSLLVNGVLVNSAGSTGIQVIGDSGAMAPFTGFEMRSLAVNDTISLQLGRVGTVKTYNARIIVIKFAD